MNPKTWGVIAVAIATVLTLACSAGVNSEDSTKPKPSHDKTKVGAGVWEVGKDLDIGDWSTFAPADSVGCYWGKLRNFEKRFDSVITHGIVPSNSYGKLAILESDVGFEFSGPCTWEKNKQ